jgi:hypothetical protein
MFYDAAHPKGALCFNLYMFVFQNLVRSEAYWVHEAMGYPHARVMNLTIFFLGPIYAFLEPVTSFHAKSYDIYGYVGLDQVLDVSEQARWSWVSFSFACLAQSARIFS